MATKPVQNAEELEARHKRLIERASALEKSVTKVEAELEAHKRVLRQHIDECRKAGFDPNNLEDEISRCMEVISLKLDTFEADIKAGEALISPMLDEIRNG
jgi:chromosome segregation ATPase